MFLLKKILSQLVMPIPLTVILLLIGAALCRFSLKRLQVLAKLCFAFALVILIGLSQVHVSQLLALSLESQYSSNSQLVPRLDKPINGTDCVVMVLGSSHQEGQGSVAAQQLSSTALARLTEGVRQVNLAKAQGMTCTLVVSGYSGGYEPTPHALIARNAGIELGINAEHIVTFKLAKDTIEEAEHLQKLIGKQPFRLVTSATHMPRAMKIFNSLNMQPQAAPTDFLASTGAWWRLDAKHLLTSQASIHEYIGMLWLTVKGWF